MTACGPLCGLLGTWGASVYPQARESRVSGLCGENQPTPQHSGRGLERRRSKTSKFSPLGEEAKEKVNCSAGAREAALGRMEFVPVRTGGLILVQDKSRGSQATPGRVTPPRNAGRDKGLQDLARG